MASPFEPSAMDAYPSKASWDAAAVGLLGSMLERWQLSDAVVYPVAAAAVVASVRRADGTPAVLKIGFPHPEAVWEAVMLDALPRDLAPAVLDQDVWTWATLLERLEPGSSLADGGLPPLEAVAIGSRLHRRLLATPPPPGIPTLADQYRPFLARLADEEAIAALSDSGLAGAVTGVAVDEFGALCGSASAEALVHGDLNPSNVLRHGSGWRLIDPKPAIGDAAFDVFSLVRDLLPDSGSEEELAGLVQEASGIAGVDQERAVRWIRVRGTLSALWNLEDGLSEAARRDVKLVLSAHRLLAP